MNKCKPPHNMMDGVIVKIENKDMNKCKTCRWWKNPDTIYNNTGKCLKKTVSEDCFDRSAHWNDFYSDSDIITYCNFGCVLWEGKDD